MVLIFLGVLGSLICLIQLFFLRSFLNLAAAMTGVTLEKRTGTVGFLTGDVNVCWNFEISCFLVPNRSCRWLLKTGNSTYLLPFSFVGLVYIFETASEGVINPIDQTSTGKSLPILIPGICVWGQQHTYTFSVLPCKIKSSARTASSIITQLFQIQNIEVRCYVYIGSESMLPSSHQAKVWEFSRCSHMP